MKRLWLALSLGTLIAACCLPAQEFKVGSPVSDFSLTNLGGLAHPLFGFEGAVHLRYVYFRTMSRLERL